MDTFGIENDDYRFGIFGYKKGKQTVKGQIVEELHEIKNIGNDTAIGTISNHKKYFEKKVYVSDKNNWPQHQFMADHYVGLIAKTLQEIHPLLNDDTFINSLSDFDMSLNDFYTAIAYLDLNGTAGQTNYLNDQTNAENYNISYNYTRVNSTSTPNCN